MEQIKLAVLSGCLLGLAFSLVKNIIPDKKLLSNIKTVMSLILLSSVILPVFTEDIDFSVEDYKEEAAVSGEILQSDIDEAYIHEIECNLEKNLTLYLEKNEISPQKLVIETFVDEYNFLEIKKIVVCVDKEQRSVAEEIIKEQLGKNTVVEFYDE